MRVDDGGDAVMQFTDPLHYICVRNGTKGSPSVTEFFFWHNSPQVVRASWFMMFLDHIQWRTTVGRSPLDEWSAGRRDLYLTTHNTHKGQTSMPPVGFEPTVSAGERPQTSLERTATGTGLITNTKQMCEDKPCGVVIYFWKMQDKSPQLLNNDPSNPSTTILILGLP